MRDKYAELSERLSSPDALKDQTAYRKLTREHSRVRKQLASNKCSADEWLGVMEEAHRQGAVNGYAHRG